MGKMECEFAQSGAYKLDCTKKGNCQFQETGAYYPMCGKPDCSCGTELSEGMKPTHESGAASVA